MAHKPTKETRSIVRSLSSFGVAQSKIAPYIGISENTLRKHYARELDYSELEANSKVSEFLFHLASGNAIEDGASYAECSRAAMFWLKTRAGFRETTHLDHTSNGDKMDNTVVVLPPKDGEN